MRNIETRVREFRKYAIHAVTSAAALFAVSTASADLIAKPDTAEATTATTTKINVLRNDSGVLDKTIVKIVEFPANGVATVTSTNKIKYTSYDGFEGTDTLVYKAKNSSTDSSRSTVTVNVTCLDCSSAGAPGANGSLTLSWKPGDGNPSGYDIYYGPNRRSIDSKVKTVNTSDNGIDPNQPQVSFDPKGDLGAGSGDKVCFAIIAFNDISESDASDSVCTTL